MRQRVILYLLLLSAAALVVTVPQNAHAQGPSPGPCPFMAPCLSIVPQETTLPTAGGTLTLKVNFTNFSTFSGWDIAIKTNVAILKPTSITLVETFLGTNETFSNCVNGVGAGCSGNDGAGVAHSSVVALGASDAGNGTLFTITYSVVAGPSTDVTYVNFPPAEDSSVSDPSGATIVDCGVTPNQCLTSSATVADFPDFLISANPVSVATRVGLAGTSTVAVSPVNGFTDDVVLAADNSACTITPMTIIGGSGTSTLSCTFTTAGTTTVTATGTSGSLSHSALVTYTVTGLPDFTISANPTAASIAVGTAGISTITISPLKAFTGDVALSADNDACTLTPTSVSGGSGKSTLSCTFATTGIVTVTVTGTSGSLTHSTKATFSLSTLAVTMSCPLTGTVGATVSCNATGSGGTSPRTFAWTATSGSPSSGIGSSFSTSYSIAGTYAISVIVTDSSSPPNSQTQSTTVTISTLTGPPSLGPCPVNPTPPPNSVPCLNISPQTQSNLTPGSTVTVSVTTTNMPTFSGWDLAIKTNNAVFNPQSLTVMETFGGTFQSTTNCINGSGLGCSGNDGAGIAHSAGFSFGANDAGNQTLFSITYKVVAGPTTDFTYVNTPSEASAVTDPSGFTLVDCSATPNRCLTGSVTVVDFSVTASPTSIGPVGPGASATSTITVASENRFNGTVNLAVTAPAGVTAFLASPSVTVSATTTSQTDMLTASASSGGTFTITVTGSTTVFTATRAATVILKVTDFSLSASPTSISFVRGNNQNSTITVAPVNGFTGTVNLVASAPSGVTATLASPSVTISTASQTDKLTVSGSTVGTFVVKVTGTSTGFPSHNVNVTVSVTKAASTTATTVVNQGTTSFTGASFHDTATVTVSGTAPTGTYRYNFFTNGLCTAPASTSLNVTLSSGLVPNSASTGALGAGSYSFQGTYSGDANYVSSTSSCEPFIVSKAAPTTSTVVIQSSPTVTGSSANDTATVTGVTGFTPTGTVVYSFFMNGGCVSPAATTQTVTMSGGLVPHSASTGPLVPGSYSFNATYSGDANYVSSTSSSEPFTVAKANPSTSTVVVLKSGAPLPSPLPLGSTVNDTATVTGVTGFTPSGSYVYSFFTNSGCTGTASSTQTVILSGGLVPHSTQQGPLAAGSYSFQGAYGGDPNYNTATSSCELFTVAKAASSTATIVVNDGTSTVTGASFHDTATVTGVTGITPTGTYLYSRFNNNACTGTAVTTQNVTLASGAVPASASSGPLAAGSYCFQGKYSGDSNYSGSTSAIEPFTVAKAASSTATTVVQSGSVTGSTASDTATVTGVTGFTPTGTYLYSRFNNNACTGTAVTTQNVTLASGAVPASASTGPLAAGSYCFQGKYSGDSNYFGSTSSIEPFTVAKAASSTATTVLQSGSVTGSTASDTATVTGVTGFTPTGTYLYSRFNNNACTGTAVTT